VVFIDELENGFHHTRYGQLWSQIHRFAEDFETQVFASTHSAECLRGALPVLERDPEAFSLIQIYQRDGHSEASAVRGSDMAAAIAHGIEVRA
jgi:AAA15 family ATPase/GTPase